MLIIKVMYVRGRWGRNAALKELDEARWNVWERSKFHIGLTVREKARLSSLAMQIAILEDVFQH